jgi:hypothetical protein
MGVVYQARQVGLNRTCALKMILAGGHASSAELLRFKAEGQAIARFQHPNIVQIFEVGEHEGRPFFSLEFCPGGSLDRKLVGTPVEPKEAAGLVRALAQGMQAAHTANVIHRDLKSANVLLAADGTPKVTDFGLAKRLDEAGQTQTGAVMGTPSFMAPEQAQGKKDIGPAVDIYALGAILYECLTGRPPFKAATVFDTLAQVISDEAVSPRRLNAKVPVDLETICLKCLQKEPAKRYPSAANLADELERFLAGKPIEARPVGALERGWRWGWRNPVVAGLAAAVVLVLLVGSVVSTSFAVLASKNEQRATEKADKAAEEAERADRAAADAAREMARAKESEKKAHEEKQRADGEAKRANDEAKKARAEMQRADAKTKEALQLAEDKKVARDRLLKEEKARVAAESDLADEKTVRKKALENEKALVAAKYDWAQEKARQEKELLDVLSGKRKPANAAEQIKYAVLCALARRYAPATRLYADAFVEQLALTDDPKTGHRYTAACYAALAGCGQGQDAPSEDKERTRLRRQALDWLRADLTLWGKQAEKGTPEARAAVQKSLERWHKDTDLAGVRDSAALEKLPEAERSEWKKLWADVVALLKKYGSDEKK